MADWSNQPSGASRIETSLVTSGVSKRVAIFGIAFVVVVGVIVVVLRVSGPTSVGADTAVRGALVSTLANNTADLVISESIDVEGQIGTAEGSGKCDLQTDACSATLDYKGALAQLGTESMVYSNRIMYLKLGGTVGASFPTPWISLPFKASNRPSALGSTGSPLAGLALLTRRGAARLEHRQPKAARTPDVVGQPYDGGPLGGTCNNNRRHLGGNDWPNHVHRVGDAGPNIRHRARDGNGDRLRHAGGNCSSGEKRVDVRQRAGGHAHEVLRSAARDAPRSVIQTDRHTPIVQRHPSIATTARERRRRTLSMVLSIRRNTTVVITRKEAQWPTS